VGTLVLGASLASDSAKKTVQRKVQQLLDAKTEAITSASSWSVGYSFGIQPFYVVSWLQTSQVTLAATQNNFDIPIVSVSFSLIGIR
jgi:hypothetical protein